MLVVDRVTKRFGTAESGVTALDMATRIYLPPLRASLVTSLRLGFGLAVVGVFSPKSS